MTTLDAFGPRSWARPEAIAFGREPMSTLLLRDYDGPLRLVRLNGDWQFTLLPKPESVSEEHLVGDATRWAAVAVPGCWTMQGFDRPQYTNVQMPFAGPPPSVPRHNPTGVYRRTVEIPASYDGQRVVLHVGGAETVLYVFVDGAPVGFGKDSRLPHEFDITKFVTAGESCELALVVVRWSDATYLEDQDHWHHAGLHRDVLIYATPPVHIADVHTIGDYDPATKLAVLTAKVAVGGTPTATRGWRARVVMAHDLAAEAVVRFEHASWVVNSYAFEGRGAVVTLDVGHVPPWSAEQPEAIRFWVELVDGDGDVVDRVEIGVGFRRVEIVDGELRVNGERVLIRGVNRHDTDARRGKAVTYEDIVRDIRLMKAHNFNAIRTSHYPNDADFYSACDAIGMYVVDEANIESHAYLRALTKDPRWAAAILERVARMAQRDKNHHSVIMWSLGNESGVSPAHQAAAAWLRAYDPTRPVHYESGISEDMMAEGGQSYSVEILSKDRPETDVIAPMYPPVEALVRAAESGLTKPLIMCEYIHAMGNSCGDADEYWKAIRTHRGLQGGFVWDWADQALVQRLPEGSERLAYGGDFGDYPNDGAFCMNGLVDTFRNPHPSLYELAQVMAPIHIEVEGDAFRVTNEFSFVDLSTFVPTVEVDGVPQTLERLTTQPGQSELVPAPAGDVVTLRFSRSDVGNAGSAQLVRRLPDETPGNRPASTRDIAAQLSLWRAPIDNETFGGGHAARWAQLDFASVPALRASNDEGVSWTVELPFDDIARVGVRLDVGKGIHAVEWFGKGPHENYSDRCASARYGQWTTLVDDWPVPYVHPQSNGNRTGMRWLRLLDANGEPVAVIDRMNDLNVVISRYTDEQLDEVQHLEELPPSDECYVTISVRERGVGSGACGPDVSEPHRIRPGSYTWSYRLR